ncbi:ATP-binding protein [Anaerocolumna jejuensis]|uniref:ATP-binding protein n=1 Tax=Anaerocolumna jejuensis TaxID=259063 RepID=UPI003F7B8F72
MNITKGPKQEAQKVVIYGPEGIGKSTLAACFPNPLFIDTEGSTSNMDVARMDKPSSFTMLMQQITYVLKNPDICSTLVIDTADWAEQLAISELCAKKQITGIEDIGYGKGYVYVAEDFGKMLNLLEDVKLKGINIVVTAHAQMRKFEQPDELGAYDRWELKLQKKDAPLLKEWADMVLFANYETFVVNIDGQGAQKGKNKAQGGKRVIYTTHHSCWDAKNRHGLPDKILMEYSAITHCIPAINDNNAVTPPLSQQPPHESKEQKERPMQQDTDRGGNIVPAATKQEETTKEEEGDLPRNLLDLMKWRDISETDIMEIVAQKGYFPADTPLMNCGKEFIDGWVIPFFDKICEMSRDLKLKRGEFVSAEAEKMPFN